MGAHFYEKGRTADELVKVSKFAQEDKMRIGQRGRRCNARREGKS